MGLGGVNAERPVTIRPVPAYLGGECADHQALSPAEIRCDVSGLSGALEIGNEADHGHSALRFATRRNRSAGETA